MIPEIIPAVQKLKSLIPAVRVESPATAKALEAIVKCFEALPEAETSSDADINVIEAWKL